MSMHGFEPASILQKTIKGLERQRSGGKFGRSPGNYKAKIFDSLPPLRTEGQTRSRRQKNLTKYIQLV